MPFPQITSICLTKSQCLLVIYREIEVYHIELAQMPRSLPLLTSNRCLCYSGWMLTHTANFSLMNQYIFNNRKQTKYLDILQQFQYSKKGCTMQPFSLLTSFLKHSSQICIYPNYRRLIPMNPFYLTPPSVCIIFSIFIVNDKLAN